MSIPTHPHVRDDAAKEAAERALRGASAIKNYRDRVKRLRRLGGKNASAALRGADRRQTTGGRRANWPYVNGMKRDPWLRTPP